MPGPQRLLTRVRLQLVAANGATELWADLSPWVNTIGVSRFRGGLVLAEKSGNFRCRVGLQTYASDVEVPDPPSAITTGTNVDQKSAVGKYFVDWDPAGASNPAIATKRGMRVGLLYSSTDATVSRGDVILEIYVDA